LFAGVSILLLSSALIYTGISSARASEKWLSRPLPPGKMVSADGHRLYTTVMGKGYPVIVIETGLGSISAEWREIQKALSRYTTVVTYDRAGYGWSDAGRKPRTASRITSELNMLLSELGLNGPLVLVGEGIGALYMQFYARTYPEKVRGAVFVEPLSTGYRIFKKELDPAIYNNLINRTPTLKVGAFFAKTGLMRSLRVIPYLNAPEELHDLIIEQYSLKKAYDAMIDEYSRSLKKSAREIEQAGPFPGIRLAVIHHAPGPYTRELLFFGLSLDQARRIEQISLDLDRSTAGLSPLGRIIYAEKHTRELHFTEPGLVIRTVKSML